MATKKYIELQELSNENLANELTLAVADYKKQKIYHAIRGLENPLELRVVRRDIARLKSELRRREISEMTPEQLAGRSNIRRRRKK